MQTLAAILLLPSPHVLVANVARFAAGRRF